MIDFIDGLEQDLVGAARRLAAEGHVGRTAAATPARRPRRWSGWTLRTILVAVLLGGTVATAGAAATLVALRGSVIPAPAAVDVPREQTPVPGTARVSALRIADPDRSVPPWTIRVARSATGYVCSTVGQVSGGRFGLVGLDGRFRELAPQLTDSCGQEGRDRATLIGARVLAGRTERDVRTVVNGVGGDALRRVVISAAGRRLPAQVAAGGAFVAVLRGYPEDLRLEATLTFADGTRQVENLGRDPSIVVDPAGGPGWRLQATTISGDARLCVTFSWARRLARQPRSPGACGLLTPPGEDARTQRGAFFAVRRLSGDGIVRLSDGDVFSGDWNGRPARTAVWGAVGSDVRRVEVLGGPGAPRRFDVTGRAGRQVLAVFPGSVPPERLRIRVRYRDGRTTTTRGDLHLADHAAPATTSGTRKR